MADPQKTIDLIKGKLEELGLDKESGSVLYSGDETIRKGKFYFLGANPGGRSSPSKNEFTDTVIDHLLRNGTPSNCNAYYDATWQQRGNQPARPGGAILQRRIKYFFEAIGVDLKTVLSTNLVFVRSPSIGEFHLSWNEVREKCWEIHKILLSEVQPDIIICYGSDVSYYITSKMNVHRKETYEIVSRNESKFFSVTEGVIDIGNTNKDILLVSIPHLSRFKIDAKGAETNSAFDTRPALEWLRNEIEL